MQKIFKNRTKKPESPAPCGFFAADDREGRHFLSCASQKLSPPASGAAGGRARRLPQAPLSGCRERIVRQKASPKYSGAGQRGASGQYME